MLVLPVLIHQYVPNTLQVSIETIAPVKLSANPFVFNLKQALLTYHPKNFHGEFHHSFINRVYVNTKTTILALNDDYDVPPIVSVSSPNNNAATVLHKYTSSDVVETPANPYSSRSLLYIQQRKPTQNELNNMKGTQFMLLRLKAIIISLFLLFVIVKILNNSLTKNISISEPIGYYIKLPISSKIERGNKYLICITSLKYIKVLKHLGLPNALNQCPYNSPYLIKQVAGMPYDMIRITQAGVLINNKLQPKSVGFISAHGVKLSPLPIGYHTVLAKDEYFMLGITPHSLDSRYFGIVNRNQFYKQALLIFKENSS